MRARRLACRCWAGRVALRENRAPTHRLTAPRQSEAGRSAVPWRAPRPRRVALLGTARSWRGIVPFTHLAREGRMTVTIGRRELLAALGARAAISNTGDWHPQHADNRFMSVDLKRPADTPAPFDPASAGWQRHAVDCRSNLGAAFGRQLPLRLPGRA